MLVCVTEDIKQLFDDWHHTLTETKFFASGKFCLVTERQYYYNSTTLTTL